MSIYCVLGECSKPNKLLHVLFLDDEEPYINLITMQIAVLLWMVISAVCVKGIEVSL